MTKKNDNKVLENKKLWTIIFIVIALISIWAITSSNKNFSLQNFIYFIKSASFIWIFFAFASVIMFVLCEGWALTCICKSFGYKTKKTDGFFYSSADIYFSAITPSASGGQPACAYFMVKDKIPVAVITAALLFNLLMYSISLILINIIIFIIKPSIFLNFNLLSRIFIIIGLIFQLILITIYYLLLYKEQLLFKLCNFFLKLFAKLHLIIDINDKINKLEEVMNKYQNCAKMIKGKRNVIIKVLVFNILQRIFQVAVVVFAFLATNGSTANILSIIAIENLVILGAYCAPIPGAIGVTDYLMLDGFRKIMLLKQATNLELFSRAISFYCCIIICGIASFIKYLLVKRSSKL